jgi:hypothetical protein
LPYHKQNWNVKANLKEVGILYEWIIAVGPLLAIFKLYVLDPLQDPEWFYL